MRSITLIAFLGLAATACGDTSAGDALFGGGISPGTTTTSSDSSTATTTNDPSSMTPTATSTASTTTGLGGSGGATGSGSAGGAGGAGGATTATGGAGGSGGSGGVGGAGGATTGTGGAGGATSTTTTTTTTTGTAVNESGCSDGEREYFTPPYPGAYDDIAGCAGGFRVPGITTPASMQPQCARNAGDDSPNANGEGCSVEDLCSAGWHVCKSAAEVSSKTSMTGCAAFGWNAPDQFWLTRQAQSDGGECAGPPAKNNLTGCGTGIGNDPGWNSKCGPLNRTANYKACIPTAAWFCGNGQQNDPDSGMLNEAEIVQKVSAEEGGVLCCRD